MLVTFTSSETGELMMFADVARTLLHSVGKETSRRGTFTRDEMLPAAQLLRAAVARGEAGGGKNENMGKASHGGLSGAVCCSTCRPPAARRVVGLGRKGSAFLTGGRRLAQHDAHAGRERADHVRRTGVHLPHLLLRLLVFPSMATTASSARAGTTPPTPRRNATSNSIGVIRRTRGRTCRRQPCCRRSIARYHASATDLPVEEASVGLRALAGVLVALVFCVVDVKAP